MNNFEKEYFIPIDNEEFRIGRLNISLHKSGFMIDVDIIQKESRKIWHHVKTIYQNDSDDMQDAISQGRQALFEFLWPPIK